MLLLLLACATNGKWTDDTAVEDPILDTADADADTDADTDADADADADTDTDTDADTDADTDTDAEPVAPAPGDLVLTELMKNPDAVEDDFGEWIELTNTSDSPLLLEGVQILDDDGDGFVVSARTLAPGASVVFGASADPAQNGGAPVDEAYDVTVFKLGNGGGTVTVLLGDTTLDAVSYDESFPDEKGRSLSLSPDATDPGANDAAAAWCSASSPYGAGDLGTPGAPNDPCDGAPDTGDTDDGPVDTDGDGTIDAEDCAPDDASAYPGAPETTNRRDDDCDGYVDERAPGAGDLVVTEIMKNPDPTADETGEWFEIVNACGDAVALDGLTVTDAGGTGFTVLTDAVLEPAEVFVFAVSGDPAVNGGFTPDLTYAITDLQLANGDDEIVLSYAGATVDEVAYDDDFPDESGKSLSLDPTAYSADANDDPDAWCDGAGAYGTDGNEGTPGAVNDRCP